MIVRFVLVLVAILALSTLAITSLSGIGGQPYSGSLQALTPEQEKVADDLRHHTEQLSFEIGRRNHGKPGSLERTYLYLKNELEVLGFEPREQAFEVDGFVRTNLWVELPGKLAPKEAVIVAAHYDSYRHSPGAHANATGVAVLLALAKQLADEGVGRTVQLVFLVNGERPWPGTKEWGAQRFANMIAEQDSKVVSMLSLDSIGFFSDAADSQQFPMPTSAVYPSVANFIGVFGGPASRGFVEQVVGIWKGQTNFPITGGALPSWFPGMPESDHEAFAVHGWPAAVITDTGRNRYKDSGTTFDMHERLDFERLARVVYGVERLVVELARPGI